MTYLTSVASGIADGGSTTFDSAALTISGTNKVLWVLVGNSDGSPADPTGVVLDPTGVNQALTLLGSGITFGTFANATLWRLIAPNDVTAKIVRATWAAAKGERFIVAWVENDIDQTTPNGTVASANGTAATVSPGAVTTAVSDRVLNFAHALNTGVFGTATPFGSPTGTERHDGVTSGTAYDGFGAQEQTATGASTTPTWTIGGGFDGWASFAFKLNVASAGAGGALSISGTNTTSFTGASRIASAVVLAGVNVSSFTGAARAPGAISITGVNTTNFAGRSTIGGAVQLAGVNVSTFVGAQRAGGALSAIGQNTVSFIGSQNAAGALSAVGTNTSIFGGQAQGAGALSATGSGTASFQGTVAAADGQADLYVIGSGSALFLGASQTKAALSIGGTNTTSLAGGAVVPGRLSIAGVSTVAFVGTEGVNTASGDWFTSGVGAANFAGRSTAAGVISISGVGGASFGGDGGVTIEPEAPVVPDASNAGGGGNAWATHRKGRRKKIAAQDQADIEALLAFLEHQEAA